MLSCRVSQRNNFRVFVVAHRTTRGGLHGVLLLRNDRCYMAPSRFGWKAVASNLNPSHASINSSKCLAHSSLRIVRFHDRRAPELIRALLQPQCSPSAHSRHLANVSPSNGLVRKQIAPAFSARARLISTGKAVMKMNGTLCPWARKWSCSSTPVISGILTSAITHDVSCRRSDRKNSKADANGWTTYPSDLTRLQIAQRTDPSSSMIEITGGSDTAVSPDGVTESLCSTAADCRMRRKPLPENHT
jgi:hypothetical protein